MVEFVINKNFLGNLMDLFSELFKNVTIQFSVDKAIISSTEPDIFMKVILKSTSSLQEYSPDKYITYFTFDPKYWQKIIRGFREDVCITIPANGSFAYLNERYEPKKKIKILGYSDHNEFLWSIDSETILLGDNSHLLEETIINSKNMDNPAFLDITWKDKELILTIKDRRDSIITSLISVKETTSESISLIYHLEKLIEAFQFATNYKYNLSLAENRILYLKVFLDKEKTETCEILFSCYESEFDTE